jgi:hypothetical protein
LRRHTRGKVIVISSPYGATGALHELHCKHYGVDSKTLFWQATAPDMNPTLSADYLERMREDDYEAYRSEVLGEFRTGTSALFDPAAIQECVQVGVREIQPNPDRHAMAFVDVSSGSGTSNFAVAIAYAGTTSMPNLHRVEPPPSGRGRWADIVPDCSSPKDRWRQREAAKQRMACTKGTATLACVRWWAPEFDPLAVTIETAQLLHSYGISHVVGDHVGRGPYQEFFRLQGIRYDISSRDKSTIFLDLLPAINAKQLQLLDIPDLHKELRSLERRRGTQGRDRVEPRKGAKDDIGNAAAGALTLAVAAATTTGPRTRAVLLG